MIYIKDHLATAYLAKITDRPAWSLNMANYAAHLILNSNYAAFGFSDPEEIEDDDIEKVGKGLFFKPHSRYELLRDLDDFGFDITDDLLEASEGFYTLVIDAQADFEKKWVNLYKIKLKLTIGEDVEFNTRVQVNGRYENRKIKAKVTGHDHERARYKCQDAIYIKANRSILMPFEKCIQSNSEAKRKKTKEHEYQD